MVTPVGSFFKVDTQNWQEWLFAIALGAGSLLVALAVKLISRRACTTLFARFLACPTVLRRALRQPPTGLMRWAWQDVKLLQSAVLRT